MLAMRARAFVTFVETYRCLHLQVEFPTVVETTYNHGGVQFKFYVTGSEVHCEKKLSIPNVTSPANRGLTVYKRCSLVFNINRSYGAHSFFLQVHRLGHSDNYSF